MTCMYKTDVQVYSFTKEFACSTVKKRGNNSVMSTQGRVVSDVKKPGFSFELPAISKCL